jgi:hypothetical protein
MRKPKPTAGEILERFREACSGAGNAEILAAISMLLTEITPNRKTFLAAMQLISDADMMGRGMRAILKSEGGDAKN